MIYRARVSSSHQSKEECLYKHVRIGVVFILIERLHSTINTLNMQYFTSDWRNTLTVHVPNLITIVLLFIKSQFTTNNQMFLHAKTRTQG